MTADTPTTASRRRVAGRWPARGRRRRPRDPRRLDERPHRRAASRASVDPEHDRIGDRRRDADQRPRRRERDGEGPPAAGRQQIGDRQQQEHRVVVPQDRRDELAGDHGDQVRRLVRGPPDRREERRPRPRRCSTSWMSAAVAAGRPELVGHRARGQVALGRDRIGDGPDQRRRSPTTREGPARSVATMASATRMPRRPMTAAGIDR